MADDQDADLCARLAALPGDNSNPEFAQVAADIIARAAWARSHNHGAPDGAWSSNDQLGVALVLNNQDCLAALGYTEQEALDRVAAAMHLPPSGGKAWLAGIRGQLTGPTAVQTGGTPISRRALQQKATAEERIVDTVLDRLGREVETAGELATLMASLPACTPVSVAETMHVDPTLPPGTPTVTATRVKVIRLLVSEPVDVVEVDGYKQQYAKMVAGVELGAVIVAEGQRVPDKTMPYSPAEQALDALGVGDVDATLAAYMRLLGEVAEILTDTPAGSDGMAETVPSWIRDLDLRQQLGLEAERLRYSAARLDALRKRIADRGAVQIAGAVAEAE